MSLFCRGVILFLFIAAIALRISIGKFLNVERLSDDDSRDLLDRPPLDAHDHNTFVFVHVSDLHISTFTDSERYEQLKEFCRVNMKAIRPRLVVASGDLTDAISEDRVIATQFEKEWQMYQELYTLCQSESGVKEWLDLRGNHDNFNVNGYNSSSNYYPKFGSQRHRKSGSYLTTIDVGNATKYAFIGVDATLIVGPKRILNFIGELDDERLSQLKQLEQLASQSKVNATIWFGHYPTSSIFSSGLIPGLRHVAGKGIAYLCGHFHTFGGIVPRMYSHHHSGLLELELADWKHNRMYRVGILDAGLFSFVDVQHNTWPVIVVTNPKPLITVQPSKEPIKLMANSSHIRMFIFSPSPIQVCEVKLDEGTWQVCQLTGDQHPLYTTPWQPELYASGRHILTVRAKDSSGSERSSQIEFALDDTQPDFPFMARFTLMIDLTTLGQVLFFGSVVFCIAPFFIMRIIQSRIINRQMKLCRSRNRFFRLLLRKLWILASISSLIYPFVIYTVYLVIGPWFYGHLIDDRTGIVFVWGTFFEGGTFLPGTFTYVYGFIHIVIFNVFLILILAHTADQSYQETILKSSSGSVCNRISKYVPICLFTAFHTFLGYIFWLSYGNFATFINPMRSWSMILAVVLWFKAKRLTEVDFINVTKTWN